jgi:lipopolysaccharide/colanic/teichoic acid biosynthesis glycosyltransferase
MVNYEMGAPCMTYSTKRQAQQRSKQHPHLSTVTAQRPAVLLSNYFPWKYWLERFIAAVLLLPGVLIIGGLVLLVRLTSRGPAIYRQIRVGLHGRPYWMYKIRTMRVDAEARSGPVWAQRSDPRITSVGRVLRKLHLDEFPQLFNVIRGEMALIGPRPERPEFTQQLAQQIPNYLERLTVLPGITGLAQINLPPDESLDCVRRKLVLDLQYIAAAGFFLDLRMFLCSATRLLGFSGEWSMWIFGLKKWVPPAKSLESDNVHPDWVQLDGPVTRSISESSDELDSPPPPVSEWSSATLDKNRDIAAQNGFYPDDLAGDRARQQGHTSNGLNAADQTSLQNGAIHNGAIPNGHNGEVHNGATHHQNGHTKAGARRFKIRD